MDVKALRVRSVSEMEILFPDDQKTSRKKAVCAVYVTTTQQLKNFVNESTCLKKNREISENGIKRKRYPSCFKQRLGVILFS